MAKPRWEREFEEILEAESENTRLADDLKLDVEHLLTGLNALQWIIAKNEGGSLKPPA